MHVSKYQYKKINKIVGCLETKKYFANLTMQTMYEKRVKQKLIFHNKKKISRKYNNIKLDNMTQSIQAWGE